MDKKILVGVSALLLTATLSGCSQVHFGRDAITIGAKKTESKKKEAVKHTNLVLDHESTDS
jgi:hypothetical protein